MSEQFPYNIGITVIQIAIAVGIAWGVSRNKLDEIMRRTIDLEKKHENMEEDYVTYRHLDAVVGPMGRTMDEIQRDIKKILMLVGKNDSHRKS